jgi:hypothetical protein
MDSIARVAVVVALGISLIAGCGGGEAGDDATANGSQSTTAAPSAGPQPSTEAVTKAASDFLDAVLKGDTQRASARLTPQALERIIASGKQFAPPGLETATFRIGQVRMPSASQALVQCVLTDTPADGSPARNEEMCCLLKLVEKDWRVSGIAYGTGPTQPWMLSDFETGNSTPIPRPGMRVAKQQPGTQSRPSPRTAQEPAAPAVR